MLQSRVVEVRDQNLYGSESNIDHIYKGGNLRLVPLPRGGEQILLSPGRNIDRSIPGEVIMILFVVRVIIKIFMVIILPEIILIKSSIKIFN